jgi:hypothetical protein
VQDFDGLERYAPHGVIRNGECRTFSMPGEVRESCRLWKFGSSWARTEVVRLPLTRTPLLHLKDGSDDDLVGTMSEPRYRDDDDETDKAVDVPVPDDAGRIVEIETE